MLRTVFHWEDLREPLQTELETGVLDLDWCDWSKDPESLFEQRWTSLLREERSRPFHLDTLPLWRLKVVSRGPKSHHLIISTHHLLGDAHGLMMVLNEILGEIDATDQPLPSPIPYRNYIEWLNARDQVGEERFWREQLKGFKEPTELPGRAQGRHLVSSLGLAYLKQSLHLSELESSQLQQLARANRCTLNTVFMAAWAQLLGRHNQSSDIVFGVVRSAHPLPLKGLQSTLGLLVNTLPLRVDVSDHKSPLQVIEAIRTCWKAMAPFKHSALANIQQWSELPSGTALFNTLFNFRANGIQTFMQDKGGLQGRCQFSYESQSGYPLTCDVTAGPRVQIELSYASQLFSQATIDGLLAHLRTLLKAMAARPESSLGQLSMMSPTERYQTLVRWNETKAIVGQNLSVQQQIGAQARKLPDALAVSDAHGQLSYHELNTRANALAERLQVLGAAAEVCVAVCLPRSVDWVVAMLAVLKSGAAYVPIDPNGPQLRIEYMLKNTRAPILITSNELRDRFAGIAPTIISVDDETGDPASALAHNQGNTSSALSNLAYVIHTSGSTGRPKGVAVEHRSLSNLIAWHQKRYRLTTADRASQIANQGFDASGWEIWPYLASGASVHIVPEHLRADPVNLISWLAFHRISIAFVPTPLAQLLVEVPFPPAIQLRALLVGGDVLKHAPRWDIPCELINHYGLTETTVVATSQTVDTGNGSNDRPSIGAPILNTDVYVLDPEKRPLPIGVPGELYIGGVCLARGYYNDPLLTRDRFVTLQFDEFLDEHCGKGIRLFRTGDRVQWRPDGQLDFLGRMDDQIKIRGHRIEPIEVEEALNTHPAVRESLVKSADTGGDASLVAYIIAETGMRAPNASAIKAWLSPRISTQMIPASFVILDKWPVDCNGKVNRTDLPSAAEQPEAQTQSSRSLSNTEQVLKQVWEEVLNRQDIGVHESFFEMGGHSLSAAQAVSRLRIKLNCSVSLAQLFESPTIADLARSIPHQSTRT